MRVMNEQSMATIFINILFLLCWIVTPFFWLYILSIGRMSLLKLSLPSFLVGFILLFQYIGFPILYFALDDYRSEFVTDKGLILKAWFITSVTTLFLCIGSVIASALVGHLGFSKFYDSGVSFLSSYSKRSLFIFLAICMIFLYIYITKVGVENIALILAIQGAGVSELSLARSVMGNDFGGGYHWYSFFMKDMLVFISLVFIAARLQNRKQVSFFVLFGILIVLFFSLTMATEKGLIADYIISVAIVYIVALKKGRVEFKTILATSFPIVILLVIFYVIFMGDSGLVAGVSSIISRGLTGSMQPIYHYLEFFPDYQGLLYGASFPNPGGVLPFQPYNLPTEVMNFVQPDHLESGIIGTMPAIYWGEIYANFGYVGLIIIPFFVGFGLYLINYLVLKLRFSPLSIGLFAWLLIHYKNLSITSLSMFAFDLNLYLILISYFLIRVSFFPSHGQVLEKV